METDSLIRAGLTRNEATIYLALLGVGQTTAWALLQKTNICSSKLYESLTRLESKGLVSHIKTNKRQQFIAAPPAHLLDYLEEKQRSIEETKSNITKLLPSLQHIEAQATQERQSAEIYQGLKGYRTILEEMLSHIGKGGTYHAFASGMLRDVLGPYWHVFQRKKKESTIKARCLWGPQVKGKKEYLHEYVGKGRLLKKGLYMSPVDVWLYDGHVVQVSYTAVPLFAVVIQSEGLYESYLELFNQLWDMAQEV